MSNKLGLKFDFKAKVVKLTKEDIEREKQEKANKEKANKEKEK